MTRLRTLWNERPLVVIMAAAIVSRLVAVIFAKGYGMIDDHFLVLEWAQHWLDGETIRRSHPAGHSIVYPGLHYGLLLAFKKTGFYNPDAIMYVVRFLHAAFSLVTVYIGYSCLKGRTHDRIAALAGLILAILWVFPFMSVRNLIEMVCIPFLALAVFYALRYEDDKAWAPALLAGVFLGLSFVFRYQVITFAAGMGMVFLWRRQISGALLCGAGFLLSSFLVQGMVDWIAYGYPYASFAAYLLYNKSHAYGYTTSPFYTYLFTIMGVLLPPTSLLLMYGFCRTWKRWAVVFWPVVFFLAFHSLFPNKQERFILPAIPFVVMLGVIGWQEFAARSVWWNRHSRLHGGLWKWFWIVNVVLLLIVSTTYSKRSRVETMNVLRRQGDAQAVLMESPDKSIPSPPVFYLGKNVPFYFLTARTTVDSVRRAMDSTGITPNYIVLVTNKNIEQRKERLGELFGELEYTALVMPSIIDRVLHALNPRYNRNEQCTIFRVRTAHAG
ncbi:MAG: glycosyltransferase family 39 protein [Chitinispirillaceae bacterium]|nr:glycosyltransferase family 39 protein [Chitinispirillaceae bacterium]